MCAISTSATAAQIESFGSFVVGGGVSRLGTVEIFDAIDTSIVSQQHSVSYIARNGWLASRVLVVTSAGTATLPLIVEQPRDATVAPGATARFRVGAVSSANLTYQWRRNGTAIAGATDAILTLTNVSASNEASYDVVVRTSDGTVASTAGQLTVVNRLLRIESVQTTNFAATVTVPVVLLATGTEHAASFSVTFNSTALAFNGIVNRGAATLTTNTVSAGSLGVRFNLAAGQTYAAGTNHLCDLLFTPVGITNQTILNLALSDSPVPVRVFDTASNSVPVVAKGGTIVLKRPVATTVNPGSGTLGENITLVTPDDGSGVPTFVRVLVHDLGVDSLGNPIRLLNAAGTNENGIPFVIFPGTVQPGQPLELDLEYYVSDRVTAPNPRFEVETVTDTFFELPAGVTVIALTRGLVSGGKFYLEFVSEPNRTYYVQYRDGDVTGNWQTSLPAVTGNGFNRQWIDNGPPRTGGKPTQTAARFYRVVRAP